ncbi:MAG: HEPN domain-containing protein [Treponema sp.]|nr:HEPN domain-containing protein [Treponema sp.]
MNVSPFQEWIELADQDEASARFLVAMRPLPVEVICFHCQQSAEKTLKAFLAKKNKDVPRSHDLLVLLDLVASVAPAMASLESILLRLNDFSVVVRYPAHVPLEESDAMQALKDVGEIRKHLMSNL